MTTLSGWSRRLAAVGLLSALILPTGAVLGAPSTHFTDHRFDVGGSIRTDDAIVELFLSDSELSGPGADIKVWLPPDVDYLDPPTLISGKADLSLATDDSVLSGTVDLFVRETSAFAGQAVITATLSPAGSPFPNEFRQTGSNNQIRRNEVLQVVDLGGTLMIPGREGTLVLPLAGLSGTVVDVEAFSNAPATTVGHFQTTQMELWFLVGDLQIGIKGESDHAISWVEAAVILPDGTVLNGSHEGATIDHRRIQADVTLAPTNPGLNATGGQVVVRADASRGLTETSDERTEAGRTRVTIQHLIANGSVDVTLDDGTSLSLDLADATGVYADASVHYWIDGA